MDVLGEDLRRVRAAAAARWEAAQRERSPRPSQPAQSPEADVMDLCQSSDDDDESPAAAAAAARPFAGGKPTWTCAPGFYEQPRKPAAKPAAKKKLL